LTSIHFSQDSICCHILLCRYKFWLILVEHKFSPPPVGGLQGGGRCMRCEITCNPCTKGVYLLAYLDYILFNMGVHRGEAALRELGPGAYARLLLLSPNVYRVSARCPAPGPSWKPCFCDIQMECYQNGCGNRHLLLGLGQQCVMPCFLRGIAAALLMTNLLVICSAPIVALLCSCPSPNCRGPRLRLDRGHHLGSCDSQ
jgi:hypothetical protein